MGLVPPAEGFLAGLRELCVRHGALLVFDEVMTGFRVGWSGAQGLLAIEPDLTCLAKVIGGGLPIGAYGGRRELMDLVAPAGPVYQAGTLSGHALAMAAGIATLDRLTPDAYLALESAGDALEAGMREAAADAGVTASISRVGSLLTLFFRPTPPSDAAEAADTDRTAYSAFFRAMLDAGVLLPPSPFEAWFLSLAHGEAEIERIVAAARVAFRVAGG
jgi:glutamate-1-semialdehyde 2,1-aminomutase